MKRTRWACAIGLLLATSSQVSAEEIAPPQDRPAKPAAKKLEFRLEVGAGVGITHERGSVGATEGHGKLVGLRTAMSLGYHSDYRLRAPYTPGRLHLSQDHI